MSEKITLKISAVAAAHVNADLPVADRLLAASGRIDVVPRDLATILFCLARDVDAEVSATARHTIRELDEERLLAIVADPLLNPRILDLIARTHHDKRTVVEHIVNNPAASVDTVSFLFGKGLDQAILVPTTDAEPPGNAGGEGGAQGEAFDEVDEEGEEFLSKYQIAQTMGVAEKIKMALTGDKEWRSILIRDANKQVSGAVIKNPRISDAEVLNIVRSKIQNDEIIRLICANKEWGKVYAIRKALAENSRTPLPAALRFLSTLTEKDLAFMAKSKNVSSVIATQARRILMNKKKG